MGQIVIACYRPKSGQQERLRQLTRQHVPILRKLGLATNRQVIAMEASDGTVVEVFEWTSPAAIEAAHSHPEVLALWERYGEVCEFATLADLPGADRPFPGFTPLDLD